MLAVCGCGLCYMLAVVGEWPMLNASCCVGVAYVTC